jgi:Tfp pilus assembly protein PilF
MLKRKAKHKVTTEKEGQGKPLHAKGWSFRRHGLELLISLFLIVATFAVFGHVQNHAFLNFDDNAYVTENRQVQSGLTPEGVTWAFTTMYAANWHPLTWLSHMLDCQLYGLNPSGHHLTNLVFHIASTLLLFLVLKRMTGALWRSGIVAALFALHPLHVESVAWVAERKDVLSTFFWMLTMWTYIRYIDRPKLNRYLLVLLFFTLGLLSKPMLVTLPFVLLLLDYWPLRRFQFGQLSENCKSPTSKSMNPGDQKSIALHLFWEKAPFFVLCAASSILTIFAQQKGGAVVPLEYYPFESRIANALVSYVSYVEKMIWPRHLAVFYPYQEMLPIWKIVGSGLLLIGVSVLVIRAARRRPSLVVGWLWYLGTLIPVIGLVQVGGQAMADRYTYVPLIGLFIMIVWSVPDILAGWRYRKVVLSMSAGLLLSLLMIVTTLQVTHWQNNITLFEHSLDVTSNNYLSHTNLGLALGHQGRIQEAIDHLAESLRIKPDFAETHNGMGVALGHQGRYQEANDHFAEALRIKPDYEEAYSNLGALLLRQGKNEEAIVYFNEALRIKPDYAEVHNNLGTLLSRQGKNQEAIAHYAEALRIKPDFAEIHNNLGALLLRQGKIQEAIAHFAEALRLKPDYAEAHIHLGLAYLMIGDKGSALEEYKILKTINPDLANRLYHKISK